MTLIKTTKPSLAALITCYSSLDSDSSWLKLETDCGLVLQRKSSQLLHTQFIYLHLTKKPHLSEILIMVCVLKPKLQTVLWM